MNANVCATTLSVLVTVALFACRRDSTRSDEPAPSQSAGIAGRPNQKPTAHGASSSHLDTADSKRAELLALVRTWNEAINTHDVEKLSKLYADEITLYGSHMTREKALSAKRAAFANHGRDELAGIAASGSERATFRKRTVSKNGVASEVAGYIEALRGKDGALRISVEGDTKTDSNLAGARETRCGMAIDEAVGSTREYKAAQQSINQGIEELDASDEITVGGLRQPPGEGTTTWTVAVCEVHPDRMPCPYAFEVDPKTSVVTYSGDGAERAIPISPKLAENIRKQCGN
jgi:hypothetical protein